MTRIAGILHEDQYTCLIISLSVLRKGMFQTNLVEKIKTHFMFNNVFPKIVPFISQRGKYSRAGQVTDDSMAHAHCMLHN